MSEDIYYYDMQPHATQSTKTRPPFVRTSREDRRAMVDNTWEVKIEICAHKV